ncbi:ABC transporter substrate-binding protein [Eggerthella guodeyinii]|uniref:ABC transporter substrate-binding protein n=1 Tax=Eggerthella guodeyinii TaxID=2690837 RepID=A0A6L7IU66_9ACTN|nr:ABC transporter substrate-binding protein [Eggerthella guodeyinii]QOS69100.1 ABC transporter substrate-binding protein [Eggerthella guodeyinii]
MRIERSMTRRGFARLAACAAASAALGGILSGCSENGFAQGNLRTVEDMGGRSVMVPEQIDRVFCTNPIGTVDLFALAPEKLAGWNFRPAGDNKKYIPDEYFALPSLGVWMGAGSVPNAEEIAAQDPDVLLCYWTADEVGGAMADDIRDQTGLPVVLVDYDVRSAPAMFRYVGELVGCSERGEELAAFCEEKLAVIERIANSIPEAERKSIFLAQGNDGLTTDPVGSMHVTDALDLINTGNVADMPGTEGQGMGMPSVNLEQVITWNPDAVLVAEFSMSDSESSDIYGAIKTDAHWNNVPCVKAGEIYRIPQSPFSWFGRPPSAARILGCLWVLKVLYPAYAADVNMRDETIGFYRTFYRYEGFDDYTLDQLLGAAGIDSETGEKR